MYHFEKNHPLHLNHERVVYSAGHVRIPQAQESVNEKSSAITMMIPEKDSYETVAPQKTGNNSSEKSKKPVLENTFLKK